jgi:hypothetical protein
MALEAGHNGWIMTKRKSRTIATGLVARTRSVGYAEKVQARVPLPDVLVGMLESVANSDSVRSAETTRKAKQFPPTAIWCKWLAHGPLKAEIRVRVPVSLPNLKKPNKKARSAFGFTFSRTATAGFHLFSPFKVRGEGNGNSHRTHQN